ncbi:MAG: hypothetical protein RRX92_00425 [Lachnospiraceae bacterium]
MKRVYRYKTQITILLIMILFITPFTIERTDVCSANRILFERSNQIEIQTSLEDMETPTTLPMFLQLQGSSMSKGITHILSMISIFIFMAAFCIRFRSGLFVYLTAGLTDRDATLFHIRILHFTDGKKRPILL